MTIKNMKKKIKKRKAHCFPKSAGRKSHRHNTSNRDAPKVVQAWIGGCCHWAWAPPVPTSQVMGGGTPPCLGGHPAQYLPQLLLPPRCPLFPATCPRPPCRPTGLPFTAGLAGPLPDPATSLTSARCPGRLGTSQGRS